MWIVPLDPDTPAEVLNAIEANVIVLLDPPENRIRPLARPVPPGPHLRIGFGRI